MIQVVLRCSFSSLAMIGCNKLNEWLLSCAVPKDLSVINLSLYAGLYLFKKIGMFHIAQYPIHWTAESALHLVSLCVFLNLFCMEISN